MSRFPVSIEILIDKFAMLPGIGRKSAQRLAFYLLSLSDEEVQSFSDAIVEAKHNVHCCKYCRFRFPLDYCISCSNAHCAWLQRLRRK